MFFQQVINGVMLGSLYALVAIGYTLIFGILRVLNFAHGTVFMMAGFLVIFLVVATHLPLWLAVLGATLAAGVIGFLVELFCVRFIKSDFHLAPALSTIAFAGILEEVTVKSWGSMPVAFPQATSAAIVLGPVMLSSVQVIVLALAVLSMVGVQFVLYKTNLGLALRATSEQTIAPLLLGVNVRRIILSTFVISSALAGLAGSLQAWRVGFANLESGLDIGLKAIAVMVIGGLGNVKGAMFAGLLVGLIEVMMIAYGSAEYGRAIVWIALPILLLLKPEGIFVRRQG